MKRGVKHKVVSSKAVNVKKLKLLANDVRQDIIRALTEAGSGHSAGSLGLADVFTALYFGGVLKHNPKKPDWKERDRLFLSNGHVCPALYAVLANAGYFPREELSTLRKFDSRLQGHPSHAEFPLMETSSGPLGLGVAVAAGAALAGKMDRTKSRVYCVTSDGEHDEGATWEAVMFAAKCKLDNLTFIMDRNRIQISGSTEKVMPLEPLEEKYRAFNWHVIEVNGHDIGELIKACRAAKKIKNKPTIIIAHTVPGKGVSFMEGKHEWHGQAPTPEQATKALKELEQERKKILKVK